MTLTPRALALREPVSRFIESAGDVFNDSPFDPATSDRRFRIMLPDLLLHLLLPPLVQRVQLEAPRVHIEGLSWRGPALLPFPALSDIDIIITSVRREWPGYERHWLYDDRDLIAVRKDHPQRGRLGTLEGLVGSGHVAVVGAGEAADVLDEWLQEVGIERRVAAIAPNYLTALSITAATDLVSIVPGKLASAFASAFNLALIELPVDPGIDSLDLLSRIGSRRDPATNWLRSCIQDVVVAI